MIQKNTPIYKQVLKLQKHTYVAREGMEFLAKTAKGENNRKILAQMAAEEAEHLEYLRKITGHRFKRPAASIRLKKIEARIFGFTFTVRKLQKRKRDANAIYAELAKEDPNAESIYEASVVHEEQLADLLDEERLHYVGAMVLGLNDALVEITGALAGVTFSLQNTKVVALTGIVTGISATLSMAASNYLAVKEDKSSDAGKAALFTGGSYLAAVILLVLPYLLLPDALYAPAFWIMMSEVIIILVAFNYYISVANDTSFLKRFLQMAIVSIGVAAIAFAIGLAAKDLLGISVA